MQVCAKYWIYMSLWICVGAHGAMVPPTLCLVIWKFQGETPCLLNVLTNTNSFTVWGQIT